MEETLPTTAKLFNLMMSRKKYISLFFSVRALFVGIVTVDTAQYGFYCDKK